MDPERELGSDLAGSVSENIRRAEAASRMTFGDRYGRLASDAMNPNSQAFWAMTDRARDIRATINRTFFNPIVAGQNLTFNPFSVSQTLTSSLQYLTKWREDLYQSRAMLGPGAVNEPRLNAMAPQLNNIGVTKFEMLDVMREMATLTGRVSQNLEQSAKNVNAFARATGLNAQVFTQAFGAAARGSRIGTGEDTQFRLFQNAMQLAGGRREDLPMLMPMFQATEAFREISRQAGVTPGTVMENGVDTGVQDAERMLARMQAINPTLYRDRPDLAIEHGSRMTNLGNGPLLGVALEVARRRGGTGPDGRGPITFRHVLADVQGQADYMQQGLTEFAARNPGLLDQFAIAGQLPAGFAAALGDNPSAASTRFMPNANTLDPRYRTVKGMFDAAEEATSPWKRLNTRFINESANTTGALGTATDKFNTAVDKFGSYVSIMGVAALGSAASSVIGIGAGALINRRLVSAAAGRALVGAGASGIEAMGAGGAVGSMLGLETAAASAGIAGGSAAAAAGGGLMATLAGVALPATIAIGGAATIYGAYKWSKASTERDADEKASAEDAASIERNKDAIGVVNRRAAALRRGGARVGDKPGFGTDDPRALDPSLNGFLNAVREEMTKRGIKYNITSTVRDKVRNKAVDGAEGSLHMEGLAVDFLSTPEGYSVIEQIAKQFGGSNMRHNAGSGYHLHTQFAGGAAEAADNHKKLLSALESQTNSIQSAIYRRDSLSQVYPLGWRNGER